MAKTLYIPEYIVELWDINDVYVADISEILTSSLKIDLLLNDVGTCEFTIDMVKFLEKCERIGATPRNILDPYRTDVKVRRNGSYIGAFQVIQIQGNFNNDSANTIEVKATSYLNLFKNRFLSVSYENMTYAGIARQLILDTQAQANGDYGVTLDIDLASIHQLSTRVRNYDLQNVKDAIINLTKLENDNFDFEFTYDKKFNVYNRIGSDKPQIELAYPQNINSLSVLRDASTLANKIYGIGSGIGEERIETTAIDTLSALTYRVRERVELFNSVENITTLEENTFGVLQRYSSMYERPVIKFNTDNLDLDEITIGDAITIMVNNNALFDSINGLYRILQISLDVTIDLEENMSLSVVEWS